jgi:hypothetical protein
MNNREELEMFKEDILDYITERIKNLKGSTVGRIKIHWDSKDVYYEFSVYPQKGIDESI